MSSVKNSVLRKQMEKHGLSIDSLPTHIEDWHSFISKLDKAYTEFQERNQSLEHTLKVSTSEMQTLYSELQKSSERRLMEAIEAIDNGFILWDKDDKLVVCNSKYKQIYPEIVDLLNPGTPYIQILERFVSIGRHKDSNQTPEEWIEERLNRHKVTHSQREVIIRDRWYLITEYKTSDGSLVSLRTDITPIKDFQKNLEQKESHLKALLNAMPGYVSWISKDLNYIGVNSNLAKFYERNPVEFIGKPLGFINNSKDDPFKKMIEDFFQSQNESFQTEFEIPFNSGQEYKYYLMGLQKFDFGESAVVIGVDITVQKELEAQIEMDRRNSFNSAKLSALGEMAAGIAHEINNPLAIIQGSASNLLTDIREGKLVPTKMEKTLLRIDRTVDRAVKIINSLRTFARDGTTEPFEPVSVGRIIDETLEFCRTRFFNSKIDLRTPMVDAEIKIHARPIQVSQVLLNLLNNAYDAIVDSTGPWVQVSVETTDTDVKLIVTDSGAGIPLDVAAKIMQPFFTTKPPGKGTGLGLSISHSIIKDHHGTLTIDTSCANTRFIVTLPKSATKTLPQSTTTSARENKVA